MSQKQTIFSVRSMNTYANNSLHYTHNTSNVEESYVQRGPIQQEHTHDTAEPSGIQFNYPPGQIQFNEEYGQGQSYAPPPNQSMEGLQHQMWSRQSAPGGMLSQEFSLEKEPQLSSYTPYEPSRNVEERTALKGKIPFIVPEKIRPEELPFTVEQLDRSSETNSYVIKLFGYPQSLNAGEVIQFYQSNCNVDDLELVESDDRYLIVQTNRLGNLNNLVEKTPFWYKDPRTGSNNLCGCCKPEVYFEGIEEKIGEFKVKKEYGVVHIALICVVCLSIKYLLSPKNTDDLDVWLLGLLGNLTVCSMLAGAERMIEK